MCSRKGCRVSRRFRKSTSQSPLRSRLPLIIALLPMVCAFVCACVSSRASTVVVATPRSPLAFHQYSINLGRVEPRIEHFAHFAFTNNSDQPIELRDLKTSCGCLKLIKEQMVVAPGENGRFALRIQSANQTPGQKFYTATALYGPVGQPDRQFETELTFRVLLPEATVLVRPRVLVVHQSNGQSLTHKISISDLRRRPLNVLRVESNSDRVRVALIGQPASPKKTLDDVARQLCAPPERPAVGWFAREARRRQDEDADANAGVIQLISVTVSEIPPGRSEAEIRIHTDDPEFETLRVPVRLNGPEPKRDERVARPRFEPADASDF